MWSSVIVVMAALTVAQADPAAVSSGEFSRGAIQRAYAKVSPAVGLVSYTAEVTNSTTGETRKIDRDAPGIVVAPDGLVMTHGHMLIEDSVPSNIRFTIGEGDAETEYPVTLLKKPADVNVCFLRIVSDKPLTLPCVKFRRDASLGLGEPVMLIGLLAEALDNARSVSLRRIGAILEKPRRTYCLDEPVRFGFVTGPVIDTHGDVVGVVGFDLATEEGGDLYVRAGHPLVYQAGLFQPYIDRPPTEDTAAEKTEEAWLGVFSQPLTDDLAEYWSLEKKGGVVCSTVVAGSPADKAGLQQGDIILTLNGLPVRPKLDREIVQFTKLVRDTAPGVTIPITFLRNGESKDIEVTLEARPKAARDAEEFEDTTFGLTVREITTDLRMLANLPESVQGVIVRRIKSGSVAELAGMRPGIIVLRIGESVVTNIEEFKQAVEQAATSRPSEIPVFCRAGSVTGFFRLEPRWEAPKE
jgi:serine protease Do